MTNQIAAVPAMGPALFSDPSEIWSMDQTHFRGFAWMADKVSIELAAGPNGPPPRSQSAVGAETLAMVGPIAVIGLAGPLVKNPSEWFASTTASGVRRKIRSALKNSQVAGILLVIESPGGTVPASNQIAEDVADAAKQKPVWAFCEDVAVSGGYWVVSQAGRVFANSTAIVGGIGTFAVVADTSGAAEKAGVKVHVVKAGEFKGAGTPGTPITPAHLAEVQSRVNQFAEMFVAAVASGRKVSLATAKSLADGRVHVAATAQARGLIDGVQSLEVTLAEFKAKVAPAAK